MNGRSITDAQLAAGVRAHLGAHAPAGLRERIAADVVAAQQARRLPWPLGIGDADPLVRRRALLLVAAVALLATMTAAAVGAWIESQKPPIDDLARETARLESNPPGDDDADAFVLAAYQKVATGLPPMRLVIRESKEIGLTLDLVIFYDGDRRVRQEYGDATTISGSDFVANRQPDVQGQVWVVSDRAPVPVVELVEQVAQAIGKGGTNCATGWESIGTETLIGRATRHVRCLRERSAGQTIETHLWIDIETGLPLQTAATSPYGLHYFYAAELEIGPQPESLFLVDGETISAYEAACAENGGVCPSPDPSEPAPSSAQPPTGPLVTPPPAPNPGVVPADLDAFVAGVQAAYEERDPVEILSNAGQGSWVPARWLRDGRGNYRAGGWLMVDGRVYESDARDGKLWREWPMQAGAGALFAPTFGLPVGCGIGWRYLGDDLVLDRPAAHLVCGLQEFWIDREWMLVTRAHDHDPYLGVDPAAGVSQVISVSFGPQPAELFAAPSPEDVWR